MDKTQLVPRLFVIFFSFLLKFLKKDPVPKKTPPGKASTLLL